MIFPGFFQGTGMPDPGWWEALWPDPAKVISDVGIAPGMAVVDLCSGDGWFTLQIAKVVQSVIAHKWSASRGRAGSIYRTWRRAKLYAYRGGRLRR